VIDAVDVADRNAALIDWYETAGRDLPWRVIGNPYLTLVSEAMLQQTQADRVAPAFEAFIERWPSIENLAEAETRELLAMWSGLGYNARALRLRQAAMIVRDTGWPSSVSGLEQLPGVGPYTAAAIASIAFGVDVPAIDTNLKRVLSRWRGAPLSGQPLDAYAKAVLASPAGTWNQAVMDLGAACCRPMNPLCSECPVARWCMDPTVYVPPPRQRAFKGSRRELRGALVRAAIGDNDLYAAGRSLNRSEEEIAAAIEDLCAEGLIEQSHHSDHRATTQ